MKNRRNLYKYIAFILITIALLWLIMPVIRGIWLLIVDYPKFIQFSHESERLTDRYDALNQEVYKSLPKPFDGAVEISQDSKGNSFLGNSGYGRVLVIAYQLHEMKSPEETLNYYAHQLALKNWTFNTEYQIFIKGTACVEINDISLREPLPEPSYYIHIWHDFFHQSFSPLFPDFSTVWGANVFTLYTFGEEGFITCPLENFRPPVK